ncbi:hypothetical protein DFA_00858 [Cavenderia fasciculata]|uniref:Uncharacterized protein n=1 Tax=Cavenderia fasciculata TaxID=261658 RepID=F4PU63_CACFS|nr:uncharacterized protein DFA_00858 [Cavenderia fasciculata]EGG20989.1 hypothetical protein DFA_00858 [Cavenderia fasciculata]|eukprot:XP_004358839.1 hypothetical protein DFA_00858 [Cavenderia fasciculata]
MMDQQQQIEISKEEAANCIEKCFSLYMTKTEIILTLQNQRNVSPSFSETMLANLEASNPDFFKIYYKRLKIKEQIIEFNFLSRLQLQSMLEGKQKKQSLAQTPLPAQHHNLMIPTQDNNDGGGGGGGGGGGLYNPLDHHQQQQLQQHQQQPMVTSAAQLSMMNDTTGDIQTSSSPSLPNNIDVNSMLEENNKSIVNNIMRRNIIDQSTDVLALLQSSNNLSTTSGGFNLTGGGNGQDLGVINCTSGTTHGGFEHSDFGSIDFSQIPLTASFSFSLADGLKNPSMGGGQSKGGIEDNGMLRKSAVNLNMSIGGGLGGIGGELDSYFDSNKL